MFVTNYAWIMQVASTLVPLLKFYFHEEVRKAAVSGNTWAFLLLISPDIHICIQTYIYIHPYPFCGALQNS